MFHHLFMSALPAVHAAVAGLVNPGEFLPSKHFPGAVARVISLAPAALEYTLKGQHLYTITVKNTEPLQLEIDRNGTKREYTFLPGTPETMLEEIVFD